MIEPGRDGEAICRLRSSRAGEVAGFIAPAVQTFGARPASHEQMC
jgi:hypothetical protein